MPTLHLQPGIQMARYKKTELVEEDISSVSSIQLNEGVSTTTTHIRYHTGISVWGSRSHLEKCLLVLVASLLLIVVVLTALLSASPGFTPSPAIPSQCNFSDDNFESMCLTDTCVYTASEMARSIDKTVDPCDDFYAYACNGWIKNNPIPDGKSMWSIFGKIELQNQLIVKNILEKMDIDKVKSKAEQKARIYYDACMDANETIEALGGAPLQEIIRKIGGWNISNSGFNVQKFDFQAILQNLQNGYNLGGLFNWAVGEDDKSSSKHVIIIDQGGLNLPTRDNYLNKTSHKKILDAYLEFMTKISVLLGGNETHAKEQMSLVIDFETELANITIPAENRRDEELLYMNMTVTELEVMAPFLRWQDFFNDAFRRVNKKISNKDKVVVYASDYLKKLSRVVAKFMETDKGKNTMNNYFVWQAAKSLSPYLSKAFRDAAKILRKAIFGSEGGEELWRYCVTDTNNAIGFAVGAMFVREVFHGPSKPQAEEMIEGLRTAFKRNLKNLAWMDSETREAAILKADAISDMIGFPDYILNPQELDKQYSDLKVEPNKYFQNNIMVNFHALRKNLERLDQPVNRTRWGMTPTTVNAYYTPTKNQIVFPAGILQIPFYDGRNPRSINYGAIGVVMGHELTHAFDDQGREYDRNGNLNQWWNNKTTNQFKLRTACIRDQYSNYTLEGTKLNGKQSLGENIADNGGLKAAFNAYLDYTKNALKNETLPGLNFTHRQLFFVSFAQVWCSSMTKEASTLMIEKDDHSAPRYRVIGSLTNLPEFSREFNCSLGSKMNPVKKCEVW
ncbi:M13 family metallopeptidase neprilysin 3 isoform X1 [Arctopsyche grandis]|uniref:M13 family metallopeptidase neprilysin 3 isoform X1 n=1 Tax=Arctopsyche grandis TaxID=121162 RepID=UPI00406D77AF